MLDIISDEADKLDNIGSDRDLLSTNGAVTAGFVVWLNEVRCNWCCQCDFTLDMHHHTHIAVHGISSSQIDE